MVEFMEQDWNISLPASFSKYRRYYAEAAKAISYIAPALATISLFFARDNQFWFWCAVALLIISIALQLGRNWWENVLAAKQRPDARSLDITLANFALTSAGLTYDQEAREKNLHLCRSYIMKSLGREYEEWEGSVAIFYVLDPEGQREITVKIGEADIEDRGQFKKVLRSEISTTIVNSSQSKARSFVAAPVRVNGKTRGIVILQTSERHALTEKDAIVLEKYSEMLAITFAVGTSDGKNS